MRSEEIRKKFLDFFVQKGHKIIPNVSLVPEHDPTVLFTTAGMHPLVPYLLGEPHLLGKRLVSVQRCLRTDDIDEVGDSWHNTFFEMLGNWSLGDYWKEEAIKWSQEFLTKILGIPLEKISVTVFRGEDDIPADKETVKIWEKSGIPQGRIYPLGKVDNFWGPVGGHGGPCGPCTEMFYDTGKAKCNSNCRPGCHCGKYSEIWNNVFMEYNQTSEGECELLKQRNVDTGMGVERTAAVLQGKDNVYETELFRPIVQSIELLSGGSYQEEENKKPMRIIADHLRAATFLISDGVFPSNVEQGYVLRRLIRRAIRFGRVVQLIKPFSPQIAETVIKIMVGEYSELEENRKTVLNVLQTEEEKFRKTLERGLREIEKYKFLDGKIAFYLYETYGFPLEMTEEIATERGQTINKQVFEEEFGKHQELSRAKAKEKFAGGLADHSEAVIKLHTATHLLQAALRQILGVHVRQAGSNITAQRLRFDFTHPEKLSVEQIKQIGDLVNQKIAQNLSITMEVMTFKQARQREAFFVPGERYGEKVKVYSIGPSIGSGQAFSVEICGGPHINFTGQLGKFKIIKEKAAAAGIRRIYATLE